MARRKIGGIRHEAGPWLAFCLRHRTKKYDPLLADDNVGEKGESASSVASKRKTENSQHHNRQTETTTRYCTATVSRVIANRPTMANCLFVPSKRRRQKEHVNPVCRRPGYIGRQDDRSRGRNTHKFLFHGLNKNIQGS